MRGQKDAQGRRDNHPDDEEGGDRVEHEASQENRQRPSNRRTEGDNDVAQVVDVCGPDRGVLNTRCSQRSRHARIPDGCEQANDKRDKTKKRARVARTFHRVPRERRADSE